MRRKEGNHRVAFAIWMAAILGLVVLVVAKVATPATASVDKTYVQSASRWYPNLLQDFTVLGQGATHTPFFSLAMAYGGGADVYYPQLRPQDVVPLVRIRLTLPPGVKITKSHFNLLPPCKHGSTTFYPCSWLKGNLSWRMVAGHPTWSWHALRMNPRAAWQFQLSVPGNDHIVCLKADAQAFYFLKGKMKPISHAPLQHTQTAACTAPPAVTTTAP